MIMNDALFDILTQAVLDLGGHRAKVIFAKDIRLDAAFRTMCEANRCGKYGRSYMCPPDVGDIHTLMAQVREYEYALVYQTVSPLEDSFDFEGMVDAQRKTLRLAQALRVRLENEPIHNALHLGAGACSICDVCAKVTGESCRAPALAMPSLEGYGVDVSHLASIADMKYTNGQNTVTYFGVVLFNI